MDDVKLVSARIDQAYFLWMADFERQAAFADRLRALLIKFQQNSAIAIIPISTGR